MHRAYIGMLLEIIKSYEVIFFDSLKNQWVSMCHVTSTTIAKSV